MANKKLMRKLEKQIAKANPKAHATLAKLLKANAVACSGSRIPVGPFREKPVFTVGGIDREPMDYWRNESKPSTPIMGLEGLIFGDGK